MDHKDLIILVLTLACLVMTALGVVCGWCFGAAKVYREWSETMQRESKNLYQKLKE